MDPNSAILSSISIASIVVLVSLVAIFFVSYMKTKAQFPLMMCLFCGFLILHNAISAQTYFVSIHLFSAEIFPYLIGVHAAEFAGLLVFLKISYQ